MIHNFERRINYYETDRMGVVHHSNYIRFLEEARCVMLDDLGIPYSQMEELGVMIPVLGVECEYKHHVTFDDTIVIASRITEFNGVRMTVKYTITNKSDDSLVLTATTKHCFTNSNLRPASLKKTYKEAYDILIDCIEIEK